MLSYYIILCKSGSCHQLLYETGTAEIASNRSKCEIIEYE